MNYLDIRTIIFSYVLTDIVCLVVIIMLWRQNRNRFAGTLFWVFDYIFQLLALILIVLRNTVPDWASIVMANTLVLAGALLGYMGLLRFVGTKRSQVFNYIFLAAICIMHAYLTYVHPDVEARSVNTSIGLFLITFQCARLSLYSAPAAIRASSSHVGVIFAAYCLVSIVRVLHALVQSQTRTDFFLSSTFDVLIMLFYQILFIALTYSLVLMYNKRLIGDMQKMESALRKSETLLRTVMDNLPVGVAVHSIEPVVRFEYMNDNFVKFYRTSREALEQPDGFRTAFRENPEFWERIKTGIIADGASGEQKRRQWLEIPIERQGEETTYIDARSIPIPGHQLIVSTVRDMTDQKRMQENIQRLNNELETRVANRTRDLRDTQLALLNLVDDLNGATQNLKISNQSLEAVNKELAAFSYSVSHDLRAPLRTIDGFGSALLEDYGDKLSEEERHYLTRIRLATQHMGRLIDDLLKLSRVTQAEMQCENIDLTLMARDISEAIRSRTPSDRVTVHIQDGMTVHADPHLLHVALTNLLDNAWKFTSTCENPYIEVGAEEKNSRIVLHVLDNGVGFDMKYAGKLFGAFQRLHRTDEFPGTGIGLATVQRIIARHGGRIWAESELGRGAVFFFTLGE